MTIPQLAGPLLLVGLAWELVRRLKVRQAHQEPSAAAAGDARDDDDAGSTSELYYLTQQR